MSPVMRVCTRCGKNRSEQFYRSPLGRVCKPCQKKTRARSIKDFRIAETYGISMDDYDAILEAQGGVCAICKGRRATYDIDHDHKLTGRESVRGLLCRRCNGRLLPASLDRIEVLQAAIAYLTEPPAQKVLQ